MILVERILGNVDDPDWKTRLETDRCDELVLDQWQAQKNRFRSKSASGQEVAVALDRNSHLHDGDILAWNESTRQAIVVKILLNDVMVLKLETTPGQPVETLVRTSIELGHALGNQHWPAVVKGTTVYVPLTVDRKVMASVMKTHAFEGVSYDFVPGSEVIPYLAPHESRRLFGGADATPHSHVHSHSHSHSQHPTNEKHSHEH
ncbi:urease accessory protein UreE [bacterium]|nr:urease accessory protein UreE [bacterium]